MTAAKTRPFSELTKDWPLRRRLRVRRRGWTVAKWLNSELDRGMSESSDKPTQGEPLSKDRRNIPTAATRSFFTHDCGASWSLDGDVPEARCPNCDVLVMRRPRREIGSATTAPKEDA